MNRHAFLYPTIEPYATGALSVSGGHTLYYEECGIPSGKPILFLHGGPGGVLSPVYRRYFDPHFYRIILLQQRGSGKSTPHGSTKENTTWDLVQDIETLRLHLNVRQWILFGGSWGTALALCYTHQHRENVAGLILRGLFLISAEELDWFYGGGAANLLPDRWAKFIDPIPTAERSNLIKAYWLRLKNRNQQSIHLARNWTLWEKFASTKSLGAAALDLRDDDYAWAFAKIETHYFHNKAFLPPDFFSPEQLNLQDLPCLIVHGRYDLVCPLKTAWTFVERFPTAKLIVTDSGHSLLEPETTRQLIKCTDEGRTWMIS